MKKLFLLFIAIYLILISTQVSADITRLNKNTFYPGETAILTINPTRSGFYNIIYVMFNGTVKDFIIVNCQTICTQRSVVNYIIPNNFQGQYYFATFDYAINDYENDFFTVQAAPSNSRVYGINITDSISPYNLFVNPDTGKNANITITAMLSSSSCASYSLSAYLCEPKSYSGCSINNYTYTLQMTATQTISKNNCKKTYTGRDAMQFFKSPGQWKIIIALSPSIINFTNFTYNTLIAVNYTNVIDFGELASNQWVTSRPLGGIDAVNLGNAPLNLSWEGNNFYCTDIGCNGIWEISYPYPVFQIDDDNIFNETSETGLYPSYLTNYSVSYFSPFPNLATCISNSCNNSIGERFKTYYNMKIPELPLGNYEGTIQLNIIP